MSPPEQHTWKVARPMSNGRTLRNTAIYLGELGLLEELFLFSLVLARTWANRTKCTLKTKNHHTNGNMHRGRHACTGKGNNHTCMQHSQAEACSKSTLNDTH